MNVYDDTVCSLGEGPLWHPIRQQLYWFDIHGQAFHTREGDVTRSWSFDENVSAAGWVDETYLLMASESRLFRFNVETGADEEDHREFKGLPSPAAAAVVCSLVAMFCTRGSESAELSHWLLSPEHYDWIVKAMPIVLVATGLLMISRVPYPHAVIGFAKGRHSMPFLVGAVLVVVVVAIEWQFAVATVILGYVLWGVLLGAYRALLGRGRGPGDDDEVDVDADYDLPARPTPSRN